MKDSTLERDNIRPTRAEINLDNLLFNFKKIKEKAGDKKVCAVVKADAYGHGIDSIKLLQDEGADYMAVAFLEEGIELRKNGIDRVPIMLLGYTFPDRVEELIEYFIEPTVYDLEFAKELSKAAKEKGYKHPVHIKVETGMNRIGLDYKTAADTIEEISKLPGIKIKGIFTHFATADQKDKSFTQEQIRRFKSVIDELEKRDIDIPIKHVENSAALIDFDEQIFDMIRPGIILYGHYPSDEVIFENLKIKPVMRFLSKIIHIKTLYPGDTVGYGRTFKADREMKVATFPAGYADGYSRILSHKDTDVYINGHRAPVLGNICMDQAVCDITDIPDCKVGDDVELFGENITAEEIADKLGTIPYEVTCMVAKRVPRVFLKGERSLFK